MKNYRRNLLVVFGVLVGLSSCKEVEPVEKEAFNQTVVQKHIIPVDQGVVMKNEYQRTRGNVLAPGLKSARNENFMDTEFVWYSLADIKQYISYIEAIQEANPEMDVSGIRMYFGAYPNQSRIGDHQVKYPGQQTLFMVPTVFNKRSGASPYENMNHLPFYVQGTANNPLRGNFMIMGDIMLDHKKQERINAFMRTQSDNGMMKNSSDPVTTSTVFNEGELSPPPKK